MGWGLGLVLTVGYLGEGAGLGAVWFCSGGAVLSVLSAVPGEGVGGVLLTPSSAPQMPPGLGAGCRDSSRKSCGLEMGSEQEGL